MAFVLDEEMQNVTNIKVIGVGGGGGNAPYAKNNGCKAYYKLLIIIL